jgi:hypothetical protein
MLMATPLISRRAFMALLTFMGLTLIVRAAILPSAAVSAAQRISLAGAPTPPPTPGAMVKGERIPPQGIPAILPHLSSIPAFTPEDVARLIAQQPVLPPFRSMEQPTMEQTRLLTSKALGDLLRGASTGLADTAVVYYVELRGRFTEVGPTGKSVNYPIVYVVFDAQTGNLLMEGGLLAPLAQPPAPTPAPTPTPLATATTPLAVVKFTVHPTSFTQYCDSNGSPLPALAVTLDNTGSNTAVSWSIQITDQDPKHTEQWASASPTSGSTPAGGTTRVAITPAPDLCGKLPISTAASPFHIGVVLTAGGSGSTTVTDDVYPFVIG